MGVSQIAMESASLTELVLLNGMVVPPMAECTVSFLILYVLQLEKSEQHNDVIFGLLCGIITIPVGIAFAGIILSVDIVPLLFSLLPPVLFDAILRSAL